MTEPQDPIRLARTRTFLYTHTLLAVLVIAVAIYQDLSTPAAGAQLPPWLGPLVGGLSGVAAYLVFRRFGARPWLIPGLLAVDSAVLVVANFVQGEVETPWSGMCVLILVMLPLFTGGQRAVWALALFQIVFFGALLQLRAMGAIPTVFSTTDFAHDSNYVAGSILIFAFVCVGGAILAGRTSVDVLNSQRQLQSEIDHAVSALKVAQARIVQQQKMLGLAQLTAGMAHEINNPLAFTLSNLQSLEHDMADILALQRSYDAALPTLDGVDPEQAKALKKQRRALHMDDPGEVLGELLRDARTGVQRVQAIIQDLKTFARMDEAPFKRIDAENLKAGIDSTLKMLNHVLTGRAQLVVEHGDTGEVEVAPALLNQVVMNLVQNAAEAVTPAQGLIRVSTRRAANDLVIEVADNGPGIPEDLRDRVFEPFFTTKSVGDGTGLGLSMSYQIVDRHGGRIEIASAPEGGAVLRVVLPADGRGAAGAVS
jgi:two-component system NtrC family sensor kinase